MATFLRKKKETGIAPVSRWRAPPEDFVKINIDAAFKEQSRNGGCGAICRDSDADVCFAAGVLMHVTGAFQAEKTMTLVSRPLEREEEKHRVKGVMGNVMDQLAAL
jgi:hypothetical protein